MKLIKFGGTWLSLNQNHDLFIFEVSVNILCTQTFKKSDNQVSN
jgi:hypothetical protein